MQRNDYYPGGMTQPGRKFTQGNADYKYSINGQEKSDELGDGLTTAEFWQYNSRIGRRWNVDPVLKVGESPFMAFAGNPIWFTDKLGNDTTRYYSNSGKPLMTVGNGKPGYYRVMIVKDSKVAAVEEYAAKNSAALNSKSGVTNNVQVDNSLKSYGTLYDINSAKQFYADNTGQGVIDKIFGVPLSMMTNIVVNGKKANLSTLKQIFKKEKLGPEWGANWSLNKEGIMQLENPRNDKDLTQFSTGSKLAHLHPSTSKTYIITYNYKYAQDGVTRTGYAELQPKAPVDGADMDEAKKFSGSSNETSEWNTVISKGAMWFYNGKYDRFKILF